MMARTDEKEEVNAYAEASKVPKDVLVSGHDLYWMRQYLILAKDCAERGLHLLDLVEGRAYRRTNDGSD
jgi:hypothetical protein